MSGDPDKPPVSRGGLKLAHALREFAIDVSGWRCADFGCNIGGFTECLLEHGAARVTAIDTGYGTLAWKLRQDPRVTVMERTNALHAAPPTGEDRCHLVVIDMGWTPQRLCIPAAINWLRAGGRIITLIKPHYEVRADEKSLLVSGVLPETEAERITTRTVGEIASAGGRVLGLTRSPIAGGHGKKHTGNAEWLALVVPDAD